MISVIFAEATPGASTSALRSQSIDATNEISDGKSSRSTNGNFLGEKPHTVNCNLKFTRTNETFARLEESFTRFTNKKYI